jgi:hypothetical protein
LTGNDGAANIVHKHSRHDRPERADIPKGGPVRPLAFLFMILSASAFCQANLAIGQDLRAYLKNSSPTYKADGPKVLPIREGKVDFYTYKGTTESSDLRILVILDKYSVGVLQSVNGKQQVLLDLTGDGLLDTQVDGMEIPYWVVAANTEDKEKTATNNVKQYLDGYYQMFQADANPVSSGKLKSYSDALLKQIASGNGENRDLLYTLYCCYRWGNRYAAGTAAAAGYLAGSYSERFHADHPLFYLQIIESFLMTGDKEKARSYVERLLKLDPGFVPAQVYRWELETDPDKKQAYLADLRKTHPQHWIVSQIQSK